MGDGWVQMGGGREVLGGGLRWRGESWGGKVGVG